MTDFELQDLNRVHGWRLLLQAYEVRREAANREKEKSDGWVPRVKAVDGLQPADLSRVHGVLIALGLLKFQLDGRTTGVRYQINAAGKRALAQTTVDAQTNDVALDEPQADYLSAVA
jgi:hypothetical protein